MAKQKKRNVEAIYALSPMQQGMLFHSLYDPEESLYVVQFSCTLSGKVNPEALQQAWQEVVNRHAVLRTFFVWQDLKEPVQIVKQHVTLPWVSLDWLTLDPALQQQQLAEFLAADLARGFELQQAPLLRLALIRIADDTYRLVWSFHHLLLDGWSTPLVIKEVFTFYEGISQGRRVELGAVRPYQDYIRWLREQELPAAEQFWREMLKGFSAPTVLGIERRIEAPERSEDTAERYVGHHARLTAEATAALQQFARTEQVTLNTVVQGAWALLLSRYSGSEDVVFGATVSGRPASLAGVEEMVGMFINTLPVRVAVKSEAGVGGYLRRLQEQQVEGRQYEYSPLVEVQGWSEVPKGMPLFGTIITFENYPVGEALEEQRVGFEVHDVRDTERNNYPLALVVAPAQELTLSAFYDSRTYSAKTITRMFEHLRELLQGFVERPTASLAELSLLSETERRHLLVEWNETTAEYPLSSCIHHLFEAQVRRSPDAVAARSASASLTFAELDARANQLAHYLRAAGLGPQAVIALLLEHSCETLIAILGVLKAGCAYLPLDPSHPPARMAFALTDAEAALLITTHSLAERLGNGIATHLSMPLPPVLSLDRDWERLYMLPATALALPSFSSSTAAYLIYTSGSTGIPKGVVIEHSSLVNYVCWAQSVYPTGDCALYSSLAFDLTVTSLFLPLVTGNTLYLYPQQERTPALLEVMEDNRCQLLKVTPSHLALIRERDNRDSRIRCLIVGGEALSTELAHAVSASFGHEVKLYNEYGPTEATVGCMLYRFAPETEERAWVPIGRPAANTQIYVLDEGLEPTAEHVTGELYIGGAGVARGYQGRAELTAERFVPDPFSGRAGGRLYRTGDRARRLAGGDIEYLGRNDEQVKYHGYRVELNELQLALRAHAQVRDAVVVLRKDGAGGREQLVGYYVGREAVAVEELRRHMQERVIAETVPQWFVHLRRLPLTLNGKVNVAALAAPWEENGTGGKAGSGAARTEAEAQLVAIWREVLGREQVRVDDNFFELGGDSILSIQIIARANRAGLQLLPYQLFVNPTVAGLAAVAGTAPGTQSEQGEVSGEAPLTPIQRWFFEQELAVPGHYNQSLLLQPRGPLQAAALKGAVGGLLSQHDALRLRFEGGADGEWRQWHAPLSEELVDAACSVMELSSVADEELAAAITATAEEVQRSLDLEHGPVLRVVWLETGAGRVGRLLLVAHHLVVDGVSWRVLLEDLERGYEQAAGGAVVELGAKTSSYREWGEALVVEAECGSPAEEEQYWTTVARTQVVDIPGAGEGGGAQRNARRVEVVLSAERTRELLQEVPATYNTQINDVLVTALARTLCWWTTRAHQSENGASAAVLVEMEGHGREAVSQSVDVSRTVGWFTSIYPVVLASKAAEEVGAALKRIKEQLRAVPRRGLGFGLLRYLGSGETSAQLREMVRAQVGFNYLGQLDQAVGAERLFALAEESAGAERDGAGQRVHALEVNGYVVGGELHLGWAYDGDRYQRAEIEQVAGRYQQELEELIAHCVSEEAGGFTPSDFPLADLSQSALDRIAANGALISDIYTLAPLQAGLLFHSLYTPSSDAYFVQLTCTLSGQVNAEALQQAWQEVVNRHAVLRTFFVWQDLKEPVQIVRQQVSLPWLSLDWRTLDPATQEAQLAEFLAADLARSFELQQAPLLRVALLRIADDTYQFVWSFHHLLLDGWSTARVIKEVFTLYEGLSEGRRVELEAARPYRDYIGWLRAQELPAAEQFWREMLKGFSTPTVLGIERWVGPVEEVGQQSEDQEVQLTAEVTAALQQLARSQQVTLNTVVQGAWALLLSRYSGSEDVVFGATVSGRPADLAGVEEMVGMFINTLPVRVQMKREEGVGAYLRRLQEQQVEGRQYEYSPLVEVQGWSEVGRGVRLFDTISVFENYPVDEALRESSGGIEVRNVHTVEQNNYSLALIVLPGQEMVLRLNYNSSRYERASIARMLQHLLIALGGMSAQPEPRLAAVPLLTITEEQQILFEWNETASEYPRELSLSELFEAQVRRSPDAVAARSATASLSFAELDQRANQLAHYLLESGLGPQAVIALLLEHSCETLIAILGVLKAGCAYLPLDPAHPPARMAFALTDAEAALLISTQSLAERLGPGITAHLPTPLPPVLSLDRDWERLYMLPATALALPSLSSSTAAYLIYTSGSTGIPKGVVIEHSSLVNYLCWAQSVYLREGAGGDCALYSSLAFDLTVTSLFLPLVTGNTLYLYPQQERTPALLEVMEDNRCQLLKLTPSHLALIRERDNRDSRIRCLIVGGEALSTELAHAVSASFGHQVKLYNEYGPTEATVGCMLYRFAPETEERAWVPIGRPAANTQIYVLDEGLEPTAEHVTGELYIGGAGVARGYQGRAELTAERFVPDPFSGRAGGRLYRTGDRARRLAGGDIEYLGRNDEQVKYHGYRVELNELQLALRAHAQVRDAVVVLRKDGAGGREQLVGYYVGREAVAVEELRRHMQERVIAETVPQWFVHLRRLPLTLNGKVNVAALAAPWEENGTGGKAGSGAARTEAEAQLVAIWREVLGREQVRVDDNFFELGGDSILSIQIIARANRAGLQLLPYQLFVNPTVAGLAAVAGTAPGTQSEQGEVSGEAPLTPIQHWFFEQELAVPGHYNQSLLLQPRGPLQAAALKGAVGGLLSQHDALRLRFEGGADGEWRQWHAPLSEELVDAACSVMELSSVADEELAAAITATAEEVQRSLDLEHGPVLRVVWLETGAGRVGRLLLVAHHLVVDGVSWRVLLEDLERGYEQAAGGAVVELGAKTSSYREWGEALVVEAECGSPAEEEQYWTTVARTQVVDIPGAGEGGGAQRNARRVEVVLSAERTRELLQEVPATYNTQINDVLVTALARTLCWWTTRAHQSENGASAAVLVEMEGHGREAVSQSVDVSRTVGWFTSIYPVVLASKAAEEVGAALKRIKEQLRAVPRRGLGFGLLRYLGSGETSAQLREMVRAQVGFNYLGQLDQAVGAERLFALAEESAGAERDGAGQRVHALEVNGYVVGGELHLGWAYDGDRYQRAEIEQVAGRYQQELEELIAHCVSEETGGFTPSDFPLADLSQSALDRIAANGALISDIYTLAPLQAGLLFHSLYTPSSDAYFVQLTCTLSGQVNAEALQQAWQEVVNRHAVLRTFFVWQDLKEPVQIVRQQVSLPWLSLDWRTLDPATQEAQLAEFLAADLARSFELQQAPLLRVALLRIADDTYQFVWSFHHLLLDGWSTARVIKEVFTLYEGLSEGRRVELEAARPYRDYIGWLRAQELPAAEQFWREMLKGFSTPTVLGIERWVGPVEEVGQQSEDQEVQLTAEVTAALQQLARSQQVTLNTVVQGAWALLLSRYSGSEDVVFGATVSGRPADLAGVEEMVGMFINTLPVRVQMKREEGVGAYLRRLQEQQVEGRQYEYSPLVEVQGWSEVGRGVRLFDTISVFENYPVDEALRESSGGIEVRNVHTVEQNNYPLTLTVLPGQEMVLRLNYNSSRYERASIARMLQHLLIALGGMSAQPEPRLAAVPLLTITEEQQILFEWNETASEYPRELSLSELFEAQAARTPEAAALIFEDTALTYRELNERANQLARYLQRAGVGPEVLAGILMNHSLDMIVAILGILKAGGAYVPLDESDSLEQLAFMIHDSGLQLLLTQERLTEIPYAGATLNLTEQWNLVAGESVANVPSSAHPESLAYVIYTSDSTEQPRGVMIQQRSVVNLATALQHSIYRKYETGLRMGFCASPTFASSVQQVVQLLHGHTLCILPEEAHSNGQQLLTYIQRYRLDGLDCTPSHLKLLGASGVAELLALAPQLVLVEGEALEDMVWTSLTDSRETRCFNIYGPTECTAAATVSEVRAELPVATIGRPLSNVQVYVLDQKQQPVGIGLAGEIYIGGDGVGRGYLNQPELTAERFIPHPYSGEEGARLYRTDDVGRYLRDGNIEYLGRHGKVERGALPAPDALSELHAPHVLPRTETERNIAAVWQEVLGLDSVGIYDNFFDIGGHSLLMVQVHDKLCERFKFEVSMVELFEYPSINSLVEHLSRQKNVTPLQDENLVLANKLREGRNRLRQQRATRA